MASYNEIRIEGTLWNPSLATTTQGQSVFKGKLSVYKRKDQNDKTEYQTFHMRAYGEKADEIYRAAKEKNKYMAKGLLKLEIYQEKPYLIVNIDEWEDITGRVVNDSPYAQNYQHQAPSDGLPF